MSWGRIGVQPEFKLQDMWIGVFWKVSRAPNDPQWGRVDVWVCFVPTLPIHIWWWMVPG